MALTNKLKAIGDAIREKTGKTDLIPLADMPNEILGISSGGSNEENPIYYASRVDNVWKNVVFPEDYNLVLKVKSANNLASAFVATKNLKTVKLINEDKNYECNLSNIFEQYNKETSILELVDLAEFNVIATNLYYAFRNQDKLKTISGKLHIKEGTNTTQWLLNCTALEDIEFVPDTIRTTISLQWCSKLTKASITSAINGLDNTVTGQTISFSKTAVNNAFGIDVDDETTYTDEFNTLRNSKSNWTFAYN